MEKNKIILDTSAYSAYLRGNSEIKLSIQHADEIFLNPVILGELLAGFIMGKSQKKNRAILEEFLSSPRVRVVAIDEETSERYAVIVNHLRKEGTPIPTNDLWISASAMQHGLKVVTTDSHYLKVQQIITQYCQVDDS
ncbi:MAG: VapC toxin family PIN domain ribonuclease [Deltaproteobacteria bacterium CG12_big_fil_rev_8_21_14_0_65_43_10]|nr:MAG: VapC toxin family PIN domain ribonuclease [Deltaproteobacteria bacterium CG2_30_43_15]PIQ44760.1 MAG: VapC toxin family PIN domain ribonuclease [Deltaproteobacteria bacterium CG12_big_fil_rev_8_21_14_0_65_43_10]PIU84297.1 MAG: VapC toxin family PIN domain ribonuclease [Deltaproteobacteria bacterium CG06_land_8_20_14_3_00_44_19]PIZ20936.1 MAG: VapC toxin family PIN domain ribonuclease [Deltaproteobacteria bacterium CG_4_10_14_0_8_um_filter_43_12]PJB46035.1 MAG: VapC toxin family PIN doma